MAKLVADKKTTCSLIFRMAPARLFLREALLIADHNSYHLGQMVLLRRLLGTWKA